ncbi:programmed cell death protein 2 [Nannochloropsis gaditana CCMP526]|uniref:programmed cell death protein 2 n=1 Tax=Nannochloropsis gaditana (strain CCMP526) TaxID=1093141 RepID=UPI00029F5B78|nr:programmed cell death protein 2 [Nannochloropsis gaditana CCMP526]EKU21803.1 programmed cell death protein 2 [Nannochloropsis gaditana CCMP526]|eukprot:XP_005854556.1 programmed cell death protein 2 [Nannochloropsis gaditana CCMP526]
MDGDETQAGEDGRSSDDSSDDDGDRGMQLGFVERLPEEMQNRLLFQDPDWRDWDGGKVGGKPIWLNPRDLPPQKLLLCPSCQDPLSFVLQIYCPLDEPEEAFHRALYVFVCQKFRCQGPGKVEREKLATEGGGQERGANLTSGGVPASSVNPPQANAPDLGRPADSGVKNALRSTFPEYEIVIEEERVQNDAVRDAREQDADAALLEKYKHVIVSETDDDASLDQQHLNQATGAKLALTDALSLRFLAVIGRYPAQILRYARWDDAAALWVSRDERPASSTDIPSCPLCGARRAFEFQVMPQLLHHLRVDAQVQAPGHLQLGSLDWGTLAVYTCVKSCRTGEKVTGIEEGTGGEEGRYVEEFVWRQKPMA